MTENPKYRLTDTTRLVNDVVLHQIQAVRSFETRGGYVSEGDYGGFVQTEDNLCHDGRCWIDPTSMAYGRARVHGDALIEDSSVIRDSASVYGVAMIMESTVEDDAEVSGATVEKSTISGYARVITSGSLYRATVEDHARIKDRAGVYHATVRDYARLGGSADVTVSATMSGYAKLDGNVRLVADASVTPVVITGFPYDVVVTDTAVTIGCQCHPFKFWTEGMFLSRNKGYRLLREHSVPHDAAKEMILALKRVIALHEMKLRRCNGDEEL